MNNNLKCYPIMVAKHFPAKHHKAGIETNFDVKIKNNIKIHTIQ